MQRIQRYNTDNLYETNPSNLQINKSPIRRQNANQLNPARSPIRSRTPTRYVSPIAHQNNFPIKFIANVSPAKEKKSNLENNSELSNGKGLKFINNNFTDKFY